MLDILYTMYKGAMVLLVIMLMLLVIGVLANLIFIYGSYAGIPIGAVLFILFSYLIGKSVRDEENWKKNT